MNHLTVLRWSNVVAGVCSLLLAVGCTALMVRETTLSVPMRVAIPLLLVGLASVHFFISQQLARGRGRWLQTVLSFLYVANFPVGTFYAAYATWVCWLNHTTAERLDPPERRARFAAAVRRS